MGLVSVVFVVFLVGEVVMYYKEEMNVFVFLKASVTRRLGEYEDGAIPAIRRRIRFVDETSLIWNEGYSRAIATVGFGHEKVNGRWVRVLDFWGERDEYDVTRPSLVVCAAGIRTWSGADVRCELGIVGAHYGAVSVLRPGFVPSVIEAEPIALLDLERYTFPGNLGGVVLGSWLKCLTVPRGEHPMIKVVMAPFDSILEEPRWGSPPEESSSQAVPRDEPDYVYFA